MAKSSGSTAQTAYLTTGVLFLLVGVVLFATGRGGDAGIPLIVAFLAFSQHARLTPVIAGISFTFLVFAFIAASMYFPWLFTNWGFNTTVLIVPSVQLIMFGMGTKLSVGDFVREFRRPMGLIFGTILVYTVMPLAGLLLARLFGFPPEIAAGVILIGSCPGGAASNVMTYLARGNVALSVGLTTLATLIAPFVTPPLMKLLAGRLIEIPLLGMMLSIMNMIIVPVIAGLIANRILYGRAAWLRNRLAVLGLGIACIALASIPIGSPVVRAVLGGVTSGFVLAFGLIGITSVVKVIVESLGGPEGWMDHILPKLALTAILLYIVTVTAHNYDKLLVVGLALIGAAIIHNFIGFVLGYWLGRAIGLSETDCRTLSIEVGLKNGGMGVGLAINVLKSGNASLASLIFGSWMNISGSTLANFWRLRPPRVEETAADRSPVL